jgi:hypothetical protein
MLLSSNSRILLWEHLVQPGDTYTVKGYGNLGARRQASLACTYFTGLSRTVTVFWYSPDNVLGRDGCPLIYAAEGQSNHVTNPLGRRLALTMACCAAGWQKIPRDDRPTRFVAVAETVLLQLLTVIIQIIRRSHNRLMFTKALLVIFVERLAQPFALGLSKEFSSFRVDKAKGIFQNCTTHNASLQ